MTYAPMLTEWQEVGTKLSGTLETPHECLTDTMN